MNQQHPTTVPKERTISGDTPISQLTKPTKKVDWDNAVTQITLGEAEGLNVGIGGKYRTMWNLYLVDKQWYKEHGKALMHLFKSFLICDAAGCSPYRSTAGSDINALIRTHFLAIPIVDMKMVDGKLYSMTLQGINNKGKSCSGPLGVLYNRNFVVLDVCLNKQWVQLPLRKNYVSGFFSPRRSPNISQEQMKAIGRAFESDETQIERLIEAAFGEAVGSYENENC